MYYSSRVFGAVALVALGAAVWFSIVLARADAYFRAATPEAVARAVQISPRNTEYLTLRALQLDYEGADSSGITREIAALTPYASAPRIKLGLAAEMSGDASAAEKYLLDAARVDRQFEPRWTLANFYFRAGRRGDFWTWIRAALDVSYGDRAPAFDLCWRMSNDAAEIERALPDRHGVASAYLAYLAQAKRTPAVLSAARRLATYRDRADLPLLYAACDQLLAARDPGAIEVWTLAGHAAPKGLFNGDFESAPLNHGFDWRAIESPGVTHIQETAPAAHRIALDGRQPEYGVLLAQTLTLDAGKRYTLRWEARTSGIKSPSGFEWRAAGQSAVLIPSADWTAGELRFPAPDGFPALELVYRRPLGEPRAEGSVELRHVRLDGDKP